MRLTESYNNAIVLDPSLLSYMCLITPVTANAGVESKIPGDAPTLTSSRLNQNL